MTNFYHTLEAVFEQHAQDDCLRMPQDKVWRYADLQDCVERISAVLIAQNVMPGDRVVVQVDKSAENLALYLATLRVGGVYVPLNAAYTTKELDYFLADAQPSLFVGAQARHDVSSLTLTADAKGSLVDAMQQRDLTIPPLCSRDESDLAAILYTSGTTGKSKGAMLSHGNLSSNAHALSEAWGWRDDDVLLHALPIFHVHGLFIASHCALLNGTPMEFLPKFDAQLVRSALTRCTVMMGVPTFYVRLLADADFGANEAAHMRVYICGSAPLTEQTFNEWETRTGQRILERYGMSETIINTTNPLDGERVPETVGFALPGLTLRIADDQGSEVPVGDVGTIEVTGPNVFSGYWRMPDKTAEEIRADGFFITGDLGTVDAQGRVSIVGRAKDLVISGGYNIYPKEVERLLDEMPEVLESAVIGIPHADFGEGVVAVVVPQHREVDIRQIDKALEGQLARFKQPKKVVNLPELPRNTMGKVQKNLLREQFAHLFS
ncbi:MAG: AMP-binding protein [Gammaproteobacteria bacterium]|nr:AMP-binding protein [Gammaproteobacteria bacterium]